MQQYRAPRWLPGGNAADDLAGAVRAGASRRARRSTGASAGPRPTATSSTSTGSMPTHADAPLLVLFHGLEGSSSSHYAQAFAALGARARLALRGAALSRLLGRAQPRAARLPLGRLRGGRLDAGAPARRARAGRCVAVGVSLGGNALLRWAEEAGDAAARTRARASPRCRRRSTWPPAATRSAAASTGWSTRACSCAR